MSEMSINCRSNKRKDDNRMKEYRLTRTLVLYSTSDGYDIHILKYIGGFGSLKAKYYRNVSLSSMNRFYRLSHSWTMIEDNEGKLLSFYDASRIYNESWL